MQLAALIPILSWAYCGEVRGTPQIDIASKADRQSAKTARKINVENLQQPGLSGISQDGRDSVLQTGKPGNDAKPSASNRHLSRRGGAIEDLRNLDSHSAIIKIIPIIIADSRKPLSQKVNAERLAWDLQFISRALALDENDVAAAQVQQIAVCLDPARSEYRALLGDYLNRSGRASEAEKIFSVVDLTDDVDPMFVKMLAQYKVRLGDPNGARLLVERFAQRKDLKNDPWFQAIRARVWLRSGLAKNATAMLHSAAQISDNDYCKYIWEGSSKFLDGKHLEAREQLLAAGKILPADSLWHTDLSTILAGSDVNESRHHLYAALQSKRLCTRAFLANTNYLQSHGQYDAAKKCLNYYAQLRPTSAELRFARARLARAQGGLEEAVKQFEEGLKLNPHAPQAIVEEAQVYQELKQPDLACQLLKRLTEKCPNFIQGWLKYGDALKQQGKPDEARNAYLHGLTLVPDVVEQENVVYKNDVGAFHARMAMFYYLDGDRAKALAEAQIYNHFKLVLDLPPALTMLNLRPGRLTTKVVLKKETEVRDCELIADALLDAHDIKNSILEYRKAIAIDGDNADLHSYLLNALTEDGDWSAAAGEDFHLSDSLMKKLPAKIGDFLHPAPHK